jgi:lycopene cyclase domain-containing protein
MTYGAIAAVLLLASGVVAVLGARTLPATERARHWRGVGIAALILVVLTAVFDNLMISANLMEYDLEGASGLLIGVAPIEDFSYSVAAVLAVPGLWLLLTKRKGTAHG